MAAGGTADVSLTSVSDKRESLTCAMCLDIFRDPKLLSCSHTFCQKCLEDLITRHPDGSFPCPSCRKDIEVPSEGASAFQANFYIDADELERARNPTDCFLHSQKKLDMFCMKCDILICMDCKMAEHFHHMTQTLADAAQTASDQMVQDEVRLQQAVVELEKNATDRKMDQQEFKDKRDVVEREIRQRHSLIVAAADKCRDEALASLDASATDTQNARSKELADIQNNVLELQKLQEKVEQAKTKGEGCGIVTVAKEMRSGCGSSSVTEKLKNLPCLQKISRPVHRSVMLEDEAIFDSMKKFIGDADSVEVDRAKAELIVEEQFRCGEDDNIKVFCVCPLFSGTVNVSFEPSFNQPKPPVKKFDSDGMFISVMLNSRDNSAAVGRNSIKHRCMENDKNIRISSDSGNFVMFAKLRSKKNFRLEQTSDMSGFFQLEIVTVLCEDPFRTEVSTLCSVNCSGLGRLRSIDMKSSEDMFVVVAESNDSDECRKVKLYSRHKYNAVDTYTSPLTPYQPADVCFFTLSQQEVLLIADERNDVIHVVDVQNDRLTFSRFLAPGCPLLLQPTALNIDHKGRLWVGCRGGRLVTMEPVSTDATV